MAAPTLAALPATALAGQDTPVKRRRLLGHAAAVMVATAVLGADSQRTLLRAAPTPGRIGTADVTRVELATQALRTLDYRCGGGACRDALTAQLSWAQRLPGAAATPQVHQRLLRALGDLHNLAGWTAFDVGQLDAARHHFATAADYADQAGDSSLLANICYRIGRVCVHYGQPNQALRWFARGQLAAQDSRSRLAAAVLDANQAWAYAILGNAGQATTLLGRSQDHLAQANLAQAPDWARFFTPTDMSAMIGTVHTELSAVDPRHASTAIRALSAALADYDDAMTRSQAFTLTMLATSHFRHGDTDVGIQIGHRALTVASQVSSQRVTDRMTPLQHQAQRHTHSDAQELAHLIRHHQHRR